MSECEVFLGLGRHSRAWAGCGCELREDRSEVGNMRVDPGDPGEHELMGSVAPGHAG